MNLVTRFTGLYQSETLVDVTLAAEGKHLQVSCAAIICPIDDFYHASLFPLRNIKILTNMQKKIIFNFGANSLDCGSNLDNLGINP